MSDKIMSHTPLDFDTLSDRFKEFLQTDPLFAGYDFEGGGMAAIMRILSYNSSLQAFQDHQVFNELHLPTCENQFTAGEITSLISYTPGSKNAARITANIIVKPSDGAIIESNIILSKEYTFQGEGEDASYTFSPIHNYTAEYDESTKQYMFEDVVLRQGIWTLDTFDVEGSAGVSYQIDNKDIDTSTLEVKVQESRTNTLQTNYEKYISAHQLGTVSAIFYIQNNRNGYYEMYFGDDQISKAVDDGNVVICEYMVTKGELGNNISIIQPSGQIGGYNDVSIGLIDAKSTGGTDRETLESIKRYAPKKAGSLGRAVGSSDYESIVKEVFPEADDVISWGGEDHTPKKYGYTIVAIKPKSSETLSDLQKVYIVDLLKKYNVGSIDPIIVDPEYFYINIDSTVKFDYASSKITSSVLKAKIKQWLSDYSTNTLEKFEVELIKSNLSTDIDKIDSNIVGNLTQITYEKRFDPSIDSVHNYTIYFHHDIKAGGVYINGYEFFYTESAKPTFHMKDDGSGVLISYKTDANGATTILSENAGTVDYTTGTINMINFNPHTVVDSSRGVYIKSQSGSDDFDVAASKGEILKFNDIEIDVVTHSKK